MSNYHRKLIEVALPLESISSAAEDENNTHVGGISNLHIWWSRKPLTTARGILFASLVDDPSVYLDDDEAIIAERERLFTLLEDLVAWKNTNNEEVLDKARLEVARSVARNLNVDLPVGKLAIRQFLVEKAPCVLDPFAGGGSIPLEGQRLGLKVHASDLNPVAVLINKALIEIPPKFVGLPPVHPSEQINKAGQNTNQPTLHEREWRRNEGLADDVRYYGKWMFEEANKRIGFLFPPVKITLELLRERPDLKAQKIKPGDELPVIAWIWTRTVKCPNPACEIQAPLVNKFWASTHNGNEVWINSTLRDGSKAFEFDVVVGRGQPQEGTVKRSGALCLACKTPIPFSYIRQQGIDGKIDFQLMCLVADGSSKRVYIPPRCAPTAVSLENLHPEWVPETTLPGKALGFRVQKYGITKHQDFFTKRQLVTLSTFCKLLVEVEKEILRDSKGDLEYAQAIITYLSLAINRLAQTNNSLIRWLIRRSGTSKGTPAFDRPIVPMAWEFSEGNVFLESVGSWNSAIKNMLSAFSVFVSNQPLGKAFQASASEVIKTVLPVVSTDPPYFDNIGYGDLSDFFYIWLRKNLSRIYPELFATMLVPKHQEIVMAPDRFDGDANDAEKHFMEGLKSAFKLICNAANPDYPVTFYYAFKQAEEIEDYLGISPTNSMAVPSTGWESMLEALVQANFVITGTWPVRTEAISRLRAIGANALASSIVLVCRPRPAVASTATRRDFIAALRQELPSALRQLQQGSIAPVDLAQAAIGPGMAIFSSYKQVLEADGTPMRVRTALALLNQALDEFLAEQEGEYDGDTRWALAWYEQYGHEQGPYGVAETLSKAKNTSVEGLVEAGFLEARAGKVRLLRRDELDPEWDPQKDKRPTAWEACQHLIYILEKGGEQAAAALLAKLGSLSETARDLAYRLYTVCERKGRAQDALGYNMLVVAWPRIKDQANKQSRQEKLF